ncbi:hypothetical protein TIFTF001_036531 [Ficus carica]|uniref:NB-ARC domain-containing protein n=1 Tax=Ficus carica TaxID=3494 RepID=A0AA88JB72_FICCA|nr:hypothetical protein TIFTF001_036531 [Ficus carica]
MARLLEPSVDVVDKILWLLKDEAKLFRGAEAEAESLKLDLQILLATIIVAFKPKLKIERSGFKELKELWERVKFVLDTYLQNLEQLRQRQLPKRPVQVFSGKDAVEEIHGMYANLETEHSQGSGRSTSLLANVPRVFLEELVGIKSRKEDLVRMLVGESSTATRLVISLVGIAGVGKTTLASVVYQSIDVQQHFDCRAWINVSQFYSFDNLFSCLANAICPDEDCLDGEMDTVQELISRLNGYLMEKRYVIVFDDVWQTDFFQVMNDVLPNNNEGCRIIITTRDNLIATSCDVVQTLQPLSEQIALELFWKSAYTPSNGDNVYPSEELSLKTVQSCHGLPLVICAMGDLFTSKTRLLPIKEVECQWHVLLDNFEAEFGGSPSQVEEVCRVFYHNYNELRCRSRLCLMYFGIFPKDNLIPDVKLVKLWIAEGFVKEEMSKTLEQVAETYLNDLINRNLVQVSCINYDGTERMCRVHGFMHHIISSMTKRYRIFEALRETRSTMETRATMKTWATIFPNDVTRCLVTR